MRISLKEFLRTGCLGKLRLGLSENEVITLLGYPEDTGGTSRKYPKPCIYFYGSVEVHFNPKSRVCFLIYIECPIWKKLQFPPNWIIIDWQLTPGMKKAEVEKMLTEMRLPFEYDTRNDELIILPSGVRIGFDECGDLFSISSLNPSLSVDSTQR